MRQPRPLASPRLQLALAVLAASLLGLLSVLLVALSSRPLDQQPVPVGGIAASPAAPAGAAVAQRSGPLVYSPADLAQHQQALLAAVNCARSAVAAPALALDPQLSARAVQLWHAQAADRRAVEQAAPSAAFISVVALRDLRVDAGCGVGGFDLAALDATVMAELTGVGIAVFPPQLGPGADGPSAVIIGR